MSPAKRTTNFQGQPLELVGEELRVGDSVPDFTLTGNDMADLTINQFKGKTLIISAVPSLDTPVCSVETKRFNDEAEKLPGDVCVLTVSMDLPFAQKRWCAAEGAERVTTASEYKHRMFGEAFGVLIKDWSLLSRAVFVIGKDGKVRYAQYVPEVSAEPDYAPILEAAKQAS
jgi:thiol peroxidase